MKIICPKCKTVYPFPERKLSYLRVATTTCPVCNGTIRMICEDAESLETKPPKQDLVKIIEAFPDLRDIPTRLFDLVRILEPDSDGNFKTPENTRRIRLMKAVSTSATKLLDRGEKIRQIGSGDAFFQARLSEEDPSPASLHTRCAIMSTDRRLLLFNVDAKAKRSKNLTNAVSQKA